MWCRLSVLANERLTRRVFLWANNQAQGSKKNWAFNVRKFFISNQSPHLANVEHLHLAEMVIPNSDSIMCEAEKIKWLTSINCQETQHGVGTNKLRSYNTFKITFEAEAYVRSNLPGAHRRAQAQFIAGVAPPAVETGRYASTGKALFSMQVS